MNTIYESGMYRIVEIPDHDWDMENLKGDMFNPTVCDDIEPAKLRQEELEFETKVAIEGVFAYELQAWNPETGKGWELLDSCHGFIGYHSVENHYIIAEFIEKIKELRKS